MIADNKGADSSPTVKGDDITKRNAGSSATEDLKGQVSTPAALGCHTAEAAEDVAQDVTESPQMTDPRTAMQMMDLDSSVAKESKAASAKPEQLPSSKHKGKVEEEEIEADDEESLASAEQMDVDTESHEQVSKNNSKRKRASPEQVSDLESVFEKTDNPSDEVRQQLAKKLKMTDEEVQAWFENRRAKVKGNKSTAESNAGELEPAEKKHATTPDNRRASAVHPAMASGRTSTLPASASRRPTIFMNPMGPMMPFIPAHGMPSLGGQLPPFMAPMFVPPPPAAQQGSQSRRGSVVPGPYFAPMFMPPPLPQASDGSQQGSQSRRGSVVMGPNGMPFMTPFFMPVPAPAASVSSAPREGSQSRRGSVALGPNGMPYFQPVMMPLPPPQASSASKEGSQSRRGSMAPGVNAMPFFPPMMYPMPQFFVPVPIPVPGQPAQRPHVSRRESQAQVKPAANPTVENGKEVTTPKAKNYSATHKPVLAKQMRESPAHQPRSAKDSDDEDKDATAAAELLLNAAHKMKEQKKDAVAGGEESKKTENWRPW